MDSFSATQKATVHLVQFLNSVNVIRGVVVLMAALLLGACATPPRLPAVSAALQNLAIVLVVWLVRGILRRTAGRLDVTRQ